MAEWVLDKTDSENVDEYEIHVFNIFRCSECGDKVKLTVSYDPYHFFPYCHGEKMIKPTLIKA